MGGQNFTSLIYFAFVIFPLVSKIELAEYLKPLVLNPLSKRWIAQHYVKLT